MNAPRMSLSLLLFILLAVLVMIAAPQQAMVALYKFALVTGAGVGGYYLDRELFPYARPDIFLATSMNESTSVAGRELAFAASMLRRAIIVVGTMHAVGMGA